MVIHKKTRLTPVKRKEIYEKHFKDKMRVSDLSREYHVSRPTIYKILHRGRKNDYSIHKSANARFRCLKYGIKRLDRIEKEIEERRKREVKPHKGIDGLTHGEKSISYFYPEKLQITLAVLTS